MSYESVGWTVVKWRISSRFEMSSVRNSVRNKTHNSYLITHSL